MAVEAIPASQAALRDWEHEAPHFDAVLRSFEEYNAALIQAYSSGNELADQLAAFYPTEHPYRGFIDAFVACQTTMQAVARDLLDESFGTRIREPLLQRQRKLDTLRRIDQLKERLWARYTRHLARFEELRERDRIQWEAEQADRDREAAQNAKQKSSYSITGLLKIGNRKSTKKEPPLAEDTRKLKLVVEDERNLHKQTVQYLADAWSSLRERPTAFLDPAISAVTALQSQTANLHCELLSDVVQRSPDSLATTEHILAVTGKVRATEEALETRLNLILSAPTSDQAGLDASMASLSTIEDADDDDEESLDMLHEANKPALIKDDDFASVSPDGVDGLGQAMEKSEARNGELNDLDGNYDSQDDCLVLDRNTSGARSIDVDEDVVEVELGSKRKLTSTGNRISGPAPNAANETLEFLEVEDDSQSDATDENGASHRFFGATDISRANSLATVQMSGHYPDRDLPGSSEFKQPAVIARMKALFSFEPEPETAEIELAFSEADVLDVLVANADGWWEARDRHGNIGLIPFNLLAIVPPDR